MVKRHMCQLCIYSFIPFGWVENGEIESGSFTLFGVVEKREDFSTQDHQKNPPNLGIKVGENFFYVL